MLISGAMEVALQQLAATDPWIRARNVQVKFRSLTFSRDESFDRAQAAQEAQTPCTSRI